MRKYEVSCERDIQDVCKRNSGQSFIGNQYQKTYVVSDPYYHTHDFYELIYVYRGRGGQYLAGEKDIVLKLILPRTAVKDLMSEFRTDGSLS